MLQPWTDSLGRTTLQLLQATHRRTALYAACLAEGRQDPANAGLAGRRDMCGNLVRQEVTARLG